jgi:hypothetical protein
VSSISAQGTPSKPFIQANHHPHHPPEILEISDSDEPNSFRFTGMNQPPINSPPAFPATRKEVIEILSSDPEPTPQSPLSPPSPPHNMPLMFTWRLNQPAHMDENPDLQDPFTSLQGPPPPPPPPQFPSVSSPHEIESMMNISSSPTLPPISSHPFEAVEDSELEGEVGMEDTHESDDLQAAPTVPMDDTIIQNAQSEDELPPLPPPSSSSPSCHIPISRGPTPTVRYLLYGGPNGIFRDANTSLLQHMQARADQDTPLTPPISGPVHAAGTPPVSSALISPLTPIECFY